MIEKVGQTLLEHIKPLDGEYVLEGGMLSGIVYVRKGIEWEVLGRLAEICVMGVEKLFELMKGIVDIAISNFTRFEG